MTRDIDRFAHVSVLCIGDVMLDRFVTGSVERISPESPVPVLSIRETRLFPGGAANVARNVAALGGRCTLVGVVGADRVGGELTEAIGAIAGVAPLMMVVDDRPTTEKMRFVAQGQQLLRADREDALALSPAMEERLLEHIAAELEGHHVVVLSDYAKGVLTPTVVRRAIALARLRGVPVIVDPKHADMTRYRGATLVTPNAREVHAATGLDPTEDDAIAEQAGQRIVADAGIDAVLVTRAHRGMTLVSRRAEAVHLPARAREVFDVVGAGDTVVATLAVAIGGGESLDDAALLANAAAGIVVGKRGTATVSRHELAQELLRIAADLAADHLAPLRGKIHDLAGALEVVRSWRRDGHAVGLVSGAFERVGLDQISGLGLARSRCDRLIVGVRGDGWADPGAEIESLLRPDDDRAVVLAALGAVDAVVLIDAQTADDLVDRLQPQLHVRAEEWSLARAVA